jgi:hypothetical protein
MRQLSKVDKAAEFPRGRPHWMRIEDVVFAEDIDVSSWPLGEEAPREPLLLTVVKGVFVGAAW